MDEIVHSAVEEICSQGTTGLSLPTLWLKLRPKLAVNSVDLCPIVKATLWTSLLEVPGLQFQAQGVSYILQRDLSTLNSVEICEQMNLTIVAPEQLRNNFVGIYDAYASLSSSISAVQRRTLERLAIAGTNGITQSDLAKEFGIRSKNFFYVLRKLEARGLIVRQQTTVKTKRRSSIENTHTNMLYLYRYAKHLGLQQKLEIIKEEDIMQIEENDIADDESIGFNEESDKQDVHVKDYLPAYRDICEKLEEVEGKVLVVSDIKKDLDYTGYTGHRKWRTVCGRLKAAQIVEEFSAIVQEKEVNCLRLLKKLSLEHFESKSVNASLDGGGVQFIKVVKRGQITEQLLELPIMQQIYDMIDSSGSKGIIIPEVLRRLGLKNKRYYDRLLQFFSHCGMPMQKENYFKGTAYRVWTVNNFNSTKTDTVQHESECPVDKNEEVKVDTEVGQELADEVTEGVDASTSKDNAKVAHGVRDELDMEVGQESADEVIEGVDASTSKDNAKVARDVRDEPEGSHGSTSGREDCNMSVLVDDNSLHCDPEPSSRPCGLDVGTGDAPSLEVSPPAVTTRSRRRRSYKVYPRLDITPASALREQRILKMLEEEKFMSNAEIHRRLEDLDEDKHTQTGRRTIERCLNKLQKEGRCRCIAVQVPVLSNLNNTKRTAVVLHPSTFGESPEILSEKILQRIRSFDSFVRREYNFTSKKKGQEVPVLDDIQRIPISSKKESQAVRVEAKRSNGYVRARMVRTKLLHIFLWRYINEEGVTFGGIERDMENPHRSWRLFELNDAVKAMPLEIYLQIIGSAEKSENFMEKCQKGLRLSDLPLQEYRCLMDTRTSGRLSWLIDILRRLQLIRFANTRHRDDTDKVDNTTITHALELKPYIEEPVSKSSYSGLTLEDLRPHRRHDFVLSTMKAVEEYWTTLEYCYADSDSEAALHAFPGSAVPEVFRFLAWCPIRAISADQQVELLKRVVVHDPCIKISLKDCEEIAKDLDLSLEQVLRVYHNKQHRCLTKTLGGSNATGEEIPVIASGKRKKCHEPRSDVQLSEETSKSSKKKRISFKTSPPVKACDLDQEYLGDGDDQMEPSQQEQDASREEDIPDMDQVDGPVKQISWTETAERQLVIEYVRYRAALGPRFNRTNWSSLPNLPAPPDYCKRRMACLNKNKLFRKAVMRLCNLLAERYKKHLQIEGRWDDFNETAIKTALGDTLACKRLSKLDSSVTPKAVSDEGSSSDGNDVCHPEMDLSAPPNGSGRSRRKPTAKRSSFQHFPEQYRKILSSDITALGSKVFESTAVSNAVELFKLIFLSSSSSPQASSSMMADTLRRYSQHDLIAAFSYLREKIVIIGGSGSKPFTLSQNFLQSVYLSPFPVSTGKRASNFASWLEGRERGLMEEEVDLPSDLQCGDIFNICALISSGELSMVPCLPEEGVGEVDSSKAPKRKNESTDHCDGGDKSKRARVSSSNRDIAISRREKGFPNIRLLLNRVRNPSQQSLDTFKDKNSTANMVHGEENIVGIDSDIQNKSRPWDAMSRYAERLFSAGFDPVLFESICVAIHKSGDQGLRMKDISKLLDASGEKEKEAETIVVVLERFGQIIKVPAYDCISYVAPLYRTKYFLTPVAAGADENCWTGTGDEHRTEDCGGSSMNNDAVHRVTILNQPKEVVEGGKATGLGSAGTRTYSSHILPWICGDGTRNEVVYKGLTRRLLGIIMQNPGMTEDNIIFKMNALNPQSCRELLTMLSMDNHVIVRRMQQRESAKTPSILSSLLKKSLKEKPKLIYRDHFFANPMSTTLL